MDEKIKIMQHNLKLIREFLGWSASRLAIELGCTRQLIQQLESGHHKMSKIQYLAILQVLTIAAMNGEITEKQYDFLKYGLLSMKMIKKTTCRAK